MKKEEKRIIKNNLKLAKRGKKIFSSYVDDYAIKRAFKSNKKITKAPYTQVVLFCDSDEEINLWGMRYLDEYILRNNPYETVVLSCVEYVDNNIFKYVKQPIKFCNISNDEAESIIMFYRLMEFDRMLKIISLIEPLGRDGEKLLLSGKVSKELLVGVGIYKLIPFERLD